MRASIMVLGVPKMIRWGRRNESNKNKKLFKVQLVVHSLEALPSTGEMETEMERVILLDMKWKGPKAGLGSRFRRSLKRTCTGEKKMASKDGILIWEEEFEHTCLLTITKDGSFQPWYIHFVICQGLFQGSKAKLSEVGTAVLNIAEYASPNGNTSKMIRMGVSYLARAGVDISLNVTINFIELYSDNTNYGSTHKAVPTSLPCNVIPPFCEKLMNGEHNKVVVVASRKKSREIDTSDDGKQTPHSEDSSLRSGGHFFDSDSVEEEDAEEVSEEEEEEEDNINLRKSFNYGTLTGVNLMLEGGLPNSNQGEISGDTLANKVTTNKAISVNSRSNAEALPKWKEYSAPNSCSCASDSDQSMTSLNLTKRSLLPWKRRKLGGFWSPQREKGKPLLKKAYGEVGGDDIDRDQRQAAAIQTLPVLCWKSKNVDTTSGSLDFGEDHFSVGSWERKELISRDGQAKLLGDIFFASIDQQSESVSGESACTALVAVIAYWLHQNCTRVPIRAELDTLIRDGSAEWRRLCRVEEYMDRFPDKHFDLDTVLAANVVHCPLRVVPERSFVGFFQPQELIDTCEFLQGAMSFDNIWDGIVASSSAVENSRSAEPDIYIVSWNDHFFVLKVESDACCYIIDTLGERLFEGCGKAYMIRFDKDTSLSYSSTSLLLNRPLPILKEDDQCTYWGLEACREFVKGFFAALTLRELHSDIEKGLIKEMPLVNQRLQIEFHYISSESDGCHN